MVINSNSKNNSFPPLRQVSQIQPNACLVVNSSKIAMYMIDRLYYFSKENGLFEVIWTVKNKIVYEGIDCNGECNPGYSLQNNKCLQFPCDIRGIPMNLTPFPYWEGKFIIVV